MANIKISELNELSKVDRTDIVPIVDVSANETKKVLVDNLIEKNVELLAISDTAPSVFEDGDKYYNTSTKKIYTAVDGSWSETGETPLDGLFYIVFNEQSSYAWNGSDLVSVGGGKEDIVIDDEEPTDPDVKLWINTGEIQNLGSELHVGSEIDSKVRTNIIKGKNLFDKNSAKQGYEITSDTTGAIGTNSNWFVTDYIQVEAGKQYYASNFGSALKCFYDSSLNFISSTRNNPATAPNNAKYLVMNSQISTLSNNLQIEQGSTATTYQAYITPTINVDGEDIYSKPVVLWTNPSPTSAFTSQNITLSSGDYDYLEVYYWRATTQKFEKSLKVQKGENFLITDFATSNNAYPWFRDRTFTYTDDTHYAVSTCYLQFTNSNTRSEETTGLIPLKIIGYKE